MAFSAQEVRVLRQALRLALHHGTAAGEGVEPVEFWQLGRVIGDVEAERLRLRTFVRSELDRYREALPGAAKSFLSCLAEALDEGGLIPSAEDLAALRRITDLPCGPAEQARRAGLLARCTRIADADLQLRLEEKARDPEPGVRVEQLPAVEFDEPEEEPIDPFPTSAALLSPMALLTTA